jgi:hypothetical protein
MKKNETLRIKIDKALANFTLAKFCGAIITVSIVAALKYLISGDFHIEYCDFWTNVGIGLLGWTLNTGLIGLLTEYLGIKGINFNLNQFLFGFETMKSGGVTKVYGRPSSVGVLEDGKPKLYNAMDSGEGSSSDKKPVSRKGGFRGKDARVHPYPRDGRRAVRSWTFDDESENGSVNGGGSDTEMEDAPSNKGIDSAPFTSDSQLFLDKGNSIAPVDATTSYEESSLDKGKGIEGANTSQEVSKPIWTKPFSGLDPNAAIFTPRLNAEPGFAVPGGEISLSDQICQHIGYNGHVLTQFKRMDLNTAMQQRYNYLLCAHNMNGKIAFAQEALSKIPTTPTTENEFRLRNQILRDLEALNKVKARSEASATLLSSRILFIENTVNNNKKS